MLKKLLYTFMISGCLLSNVQATDHLDSQDPSSKVQPISFKLPPEIWDQVGRELIERFSESSDRHYLGIKDVINLSKVDKHLNQSMQHILSQPEHKEFTQMLSNCSSTYLRYYNSLQKTDSRWHIARNTLETLFGNKISNQFIEINEIKAFLYGMHVFSNKSLILKFEDPETNEILELPRIDETQINGLSSKIKNSIISQILSQIQVLGYHSKIGKPLSIKVVENNVNQSSCLNELISLFLRSKEIIKQSHQSSIEYLEDNDQTKDNWKKQAEQTYDHLLYLIELMKNFSKV